MQWLYADETLWWPWLVAFGVVYLWEGWQNRSIGLALRCSGGRIWYKLLWRAGVFVLLLVALEGPSLAEGGKIELEVRSKDILFCVDASASMNARDVAPSRLEKLKLELRETILSLEGNRMGLIIFSSEAYMHCPLTYDLGALLLFLDAVRTDLMPGGGTDFGAALELAQQKLKEAAQQHHEPTEQAVVLISDGEDFGTTTKEASAALQEEGIRRFAMGIGTKEGAEIPTERGPKRDREGEVVRTRLISDPLRATADSYFEINERFNQMPQLRTALKELQGTQQKSKISTGEHNVYVYVLGLAIFLFILDLLYPIRRFRL